MNISIDNLPHLSELPSAKNIGSSQILPFHSKELRESAIPDELAHKAGIRSVTDIEARRLLNCDGWYAGCNLTGWAVPYRCPLTGDVRFYQLKLDEALPDLEKEGKRRKYLFPTGIQNSVYFPPDLAPEALSDPTIPILITEGVKKALSIYAALSNKYFVIALPGVWNWLTKDDNGVSRPIPDFDLIVCSERTINIVFDSDAVTNSGVLHAEIRLASELQHRGARVRIVRILHDPGKKFGADDFIAAQGADAFKRLIAEAKPFSVTRQLRGFINHIQPDNEEGRNFVLRSLADLPAIDREQILKQLSEKLELSVKVLREHYQVLTRRKFTDISSLLSNVQVLGEYGDNTIALYAKDTRKLHRIKPSELNYTTLVQVAGESVLNEIHRNEYSAFLDRLAIEARQRQLGHFDIYGQGIWRMNDNRLAIVCGDRVTLWDGKRGENYESPVLDRTLFDLRTSDVWADLDVLIRDTENMDADQATETLAELGKIISQWHFMRNTEDRLVAALILTTLVQTIWTWRPQVWLLGGSSTGKSLLLQLIADMFPRLAHLAQSRISEAGLRQTIRADAPIILLDEFENNKHRQAIMDMLRSAGRGGVITKGTTTHDPIRFRICHTTWVASIEKNLIAKADRNRYIVLQTREVAEGVSFKIPDSQTLERLGQKLLAVALRYSLEAKARADRLAQTEINAVGGRFVENFAVPVSILSLITGTNEEKAADTLKKVVNEFVDIESDTQADESELIADILKSSINVPVEQDNPGGKPVTTHEPRSVADLLQDMRYTKILETFGIKSLEDKRLFLDPVTVGQKLLRQTRWEGLSLREILLRHPGAHKMRGRYSDGLRPRGVVIPTATMAIFNE